MGFTWEQGREVKQNTPGTWQHKQMSKIFQETVRQSQYGENLILEDVEDKKTNMEKENVFETEKMERKLKVAFHNNQMDRDKTISETQKQRRKQD